MTCDSSYVMIILKCGYLGNSAIIREISNVKRLSREPEVIVERVAG